MEDSIKLLKEKEPRIDEADFRMADEGALQPAKGGSTRITNGEETACDGRSGSWGFGLALIIVGVLFMLGNFTGFRLDNWWALFIFIPAMGAFGSFLSSVRRKGGMNREAFGSLIGALIITTVALIFLLGLNWGTIWPIFLIIGGIGALFSGMFKE